MATILIATPDIKEAKGLLDGFTRRGFAADDAGSGAIWGFSIPRFDVRVNVGGNGKSQFAAQTRYLLDRSPDVTALLCVGAAGRLDDTLDVGDIVVGTRTVEHDCKPRMSPKPLPRHDPDPAILRQFMDVAATHAFPFRVRGGSIASGDEDIVDIIRAQELRADTDALCAAWEGSGGARAAALTGVPFLEIRAISDHADGNANAAFQANVGPAMANVADLLIAWLNARRIR